jgi:hypothetical protein
MMEIAAEGSLSEAMAQRSIFNDRGLESPGRTTWVCTMRAIAIDSIPIHRTVGG